jgi:site-specific DNA-methyltransferase (adenine-specific)
MTVTKLKPQQYFPFDRAKGNHDNRLTPKQLYNKLDAEFHFNYDPCPANPTVGMREKDGLGSWGTRNYVNPPYSEKAVWIKKAIEEQQKGKLSVLLLPVDTSTSWFHDLVIPNAEIRWIRGRVQFIPGMPAKFASMVCIFRPKTVFNSEKINREVEK